MTEKYIIVSLGDEKAKALGEIISNPSCKKIVELLAEKDMSASEIASNLKMPQNSAGYNIDKLVNAGVIEKVKGFFWSSKGKKMERYRVSNKAIVISAKKTGIYSKLKGVMPAILISGLLTGAIAWYYKAQFGVQKAAEKAITAPVLESASYSATGVSGATAITAGTIYPWFWFALGGLAVIVIFLIWNWKKL